MGTRNKLIDLNNHLFMQLERLNEEDLEGDKLQEEITRAKAITGTAAQIINNAALVLRAEQFLQEHGLGGKNKNVRKRLPAMLREEHLGELLSD